MLTMVIMENSLVKGQVKAGDILKSISFAGENGTETLEITRQHHIVDAMLKARAGDEITVGVIRDGEEVYAKVTMTEKHISDYFCVCRVRSRTSQAYYR